MSGFNFGAGGPSFNFGAAATPVATTTAAASTTATPAGGFSFGATGAAAPSYGFGQTPQAANPAANLSFAGGTPAGGFSFATPAATVAPTLSAAPAMQPSAGGFTLGGSAGGFGLGGQKPTSAVAPTSLTATPSMTAGGLGTGLQFGGGIPSGTAATTTAAPQQGGLMAGLLSGGIPSGTAATTTAAPQQGGLMAGLLSQKPAQTTTPSTTGFSLGQPAASATLGMGNLGGGLGGAPSLGQPAASAGLGGGLGGAPSLGQSTLQSSGLGGGLGGTPSLAQSLTKPTAPMGLGLSQSAAPAPATQATGFKLGGAPTQATPSAPPGGLGVTFGGAKTTGGLTLGTAVQATATTGATLSTATSTSASTAAPATMNYRTLEESINKWTLELEEQEKIFLEQATQVNAWDRLLIDNGDKITELNTNVERVKLDQQRLDQELDFILSQQKELEELIVPLEQAVERLPPLHYQQHADLEREHTYKLGENIDAQLKTMSRDLKEIIEHLNTSNINQDNTDPVTQIAKILNAHMDSLSWVDQNTALLQRRVEEVSRQTESQRKEQERTYRLAYD